MNMMVTSKIVKAQRTVTNRSIQTINAYSCQLYIDSFRISYRGFVYFSWVSNSTQINSLRYESTGKSVQVKQTLTISVRVAVKNGKEQPLQTSLKLFTNSGQQLDQYQLDVNTFGSQFKEMEIPMNRGLCSIRIRKRQMIISGSGDIQLNTRNIYRSKNSKIEHRQSQQINQYQLMQQELNKIKKELEDQQYLNNKLKNDRDVLLVTQQELQYQIQTLLIQITKEIGILRSHYQNRMTIRQHCYEEEIEDMVKTFNSQSEQNKKVMELVMRQKNKLQEEVKPLHQKIKYLQNEGHIKDQNFNQLLRDKDQINLKLQEMNEHNLSLNRRIQTMSKDQETSNQQCQSHRNLIVTLQKQIGNLNIQINNQTQDISKLNEKINDLELINKNKDSFIIELSQKQKKYLQDLQNVIKENNMHKYQTQLLQEQKKKLYEQLEYLNGKFQQYQYEMEFNQNVMNQLKKQQTQKQQELYTQIENLQKIYAKKMEDIIAGFQAEKGQIQTTSQIAQKQKEDLESKIKELSSHAQQSQLKMNQLNNEILKLQNSIKNNGNNGSAKDELIELLQKQIDKLKEQLEHHRMQKMKNSEKKSQKSKQSPKKIDLQQFQELQRKLLQLQKQNKDLERELQIAKSGAGDDISGRLQKKPTSSKDLMEHLNKSDGKTIRGSIHEKQMTEEQIINLMQQKELQINELRKKVQQLQNQYFNIQQRFDKILQKYPQVDLAVIDQEVPRIIQCCDSEKQEERILNQNLNIASPTPLKENQRPKFRRSQSIAEQFSHQDDKQPHYTDKGKLQKRKYEPASQSRIKVQDSLHRGVTRKESLRQDSLRQDSLRQSPLRVEIVNHPNLGKNISGTSKDNQSEKSGTSYVRVSHTRKIKELQADNRDLQQKQQAFLRQIQAYQLNINALKAELNKYKQDLSPRDLPTPTLGMTRAEVIKENKQSQVLIEDQKYQHLMKQSQLKQVQYQKKNLRIGDLQEEIRQISKQKAERQSYTISLEIKLQQIQKRQDQMAKKMDLLNQTIKQLQRQLAQFQEKLRKQKENAQQARLSVKQINLHLENAQNQLKKLRHQNQILEQKVQKMSGSQLVIRQLTKQIQDLGKKQLQMTRTINHMKLQKDQVDEQLRMFKKRQNDQLRIASQWQQKAASLQRQLQQLRRKQSKLKRQVQQGQQEVRRSKLQQKKLQQEIQAFGAAQVGWQVERRKHLDQISSLQDQLSRKDYELNKLTKQIQKWRIRAQEKDDFRLGKKNQLKQEIQRLENELIRKQKRLFQQTQQNKLLKGRLQLLERQNKRIIEHKNQSYGQKLKYYVDEMSSIKKLLEQYQNQNSRLKVQNNQLYEQSEMLRINYDKLEARYNQNIQRQQDILNDLQGYINQVNMLKDRLTHANSEIDQIQNAFANLHKQNDNQRLQTRKMAQKLDISERNLQRAQIQIRQYRVKQSQFETNNEINNKIGQKYRALQRRKTQLQQENKKLKSQCQNILNTYTFRREDLQKAVNQARNQERKIRQQEMQRMEQDFNKTLISKTQRLEQELLDMYNENNKLRSDLQMLMQENGKQKGRLNELQIISSRIGTLQEEHQINKITMEQLKEELRKKNEKINKIQVTIQGLASENSLKDRQINNAANRMKELERTIQKLNEQLKTRRNAQKQLQDALTKATSFKQKQKTDENSIYRQRQSQLIQQYQSKISTYQLQLQRAKDRQNRNIEQNVSKMKKLEQKMDEMEQALKQKQKAIIGQYEGELQQLQNSLMRLSQELQDKLIRQDELNEAIILLQGENKELMKQLQQIQHQYQQQKQIIEAQLNKLKLKMKDAETLYANNLKALEEDLIKATQARGNNNASSRVKNNEAEERVAKRFDQKLKNKDKKIQQLKQSIYTLEQTILKLKKKETIYQTSLTEIQKYKLMLAQFQKERKKLEFEWSQDTNKNSDLIRQLRKQILKLKEEQQKSRLIAEEKIMEYDSTFCQLKTIKQLYQELQKQLERRKHNLSLQMEEETSLQHQVRIQQSKIIQLEQRLLQNIKTIKQYENQIKRKNSQIKRQAQTIQQDKKNQDQYKIDLNKLSNQIASLKKSNNQFNITCDSIKSQLKQSKSDYLKLRKSHDELKSVSLNHQQLSIQLKRVNQQLVSRYRQSEQVARRYNMLNQRSREQIGIGIEQILQRYSIFIEDKDAEINQLIQQIEELKFLNERKFMDYDQMKKNNFELQLKVQEYQTLNDQLQTLRKICDKLQQQKKNSVFRQEVLRMQIQNLAANGTSQLRSRIQNILAAPIVPSYNNFSFY